MVKKKSAKPSTLTVKYKKLALWTDLCETITTRYLDEGEMLTLLEPKFYYRSPMADKPYYHVNHHVYGEGYCLAEAF